MTKYENTLVYIHILLIRKKFTCRLKQKSFNKKNVLQKVNNYLHFTYSRQYNWIWNNMYEL